MRNAIRCFLLCLLAGCFLSARASDSDRTTKLNRAFRAIPTETDVRKLEDAAQYQPSDTIDGEELGSSVFRLRSAAYIRLGAIGSADAIAAIQRIRTRAQQMVPNSPTVLFGFIDNPARHEGAISLQPMAETTASDGTEYAIVYAPLMGDIDLFLMLRKPDDAQWNRLNSFPIGFIAALANRS